MSSEPFPLVQNQTYTDAPRSLARSMKRSLPSKVSPLFSTACIAQNIIKCKYGNMLTWGQHTPWCKSKAEITEWGKYGVLWAFHLLCFFFSLKFNMRITFWASILIFSKSHISNLSNIMEKLRAGGKKTVLEKWPKLQKFTRCYITPGDYSWPCQTSKLLKHQHDSS
jgi:hypothetical protein